MRTSEADQRGEKHIEHLLLPGFMTDSLLSFGCFIQSVPKNAAIASDDDEF